MNTHIVSNVGGGNRPRLSLQASIALQERDGILPIWVRAPVVGPERFTGLTRPKLYELATKGHIKSASLREPGQTRGVRLFHLRSILDYIEGVANSVSTITREENYAR